MATNLFSRAAAYRKKHKNLTMPEAVKAVSKGAKVTGTKKKKTVGKLKAVKNVKHCIDVPGKKSIGSVKKSKRSVKKSSGSKLKTMLKTAGDIVKLEKLRAQYKGGSSINKDIRDAYQLEINKLHHRLNSMKKHY